MASWTGFLWACLLGTPMNTPFGFNPESIRAETRIHNKDHSQRIPLPVLYSLTGDSYVKKYNWRLGASILSLETLYRFGIKPEWRPRRASRVISTRKRQFPRQGRNLLTSRELGASAAKLRQLLTVRRPAALAQRHVAPPRPTARHNWASAPLQSLYGPLGASKADRPPEQIERAICSSTLWQARE